MIQMPIWIGLQMRINPSVLLCALCGDKKSHHGGHGETQRRIGLLMNFNITGVKDGIVQWII